MPKQEDYLQKEQKELPVGTIESVDRDTISIRITIDGNETVFPFKPTPKVLDFISNPKFAHDYAKGKVVEFSAHNGILTLIRKAGGFKKASVDIPEKKPIAPVVDAEKEQREQSKLRDMEREIDRLKEQERKVGIEALAQQQRMDIPIKPSDTAVMVTNTGTFDKNKVHGYEVSDTCQMVQFEPITIKVIGEDIETCRRALIDAWQVFGQHNEIVRDNVNKHIERSLLKGV